MFSQRSQRIRTSVALAVLLCAPAAAAAAQPRVQLLDAVGESRLLIAIGPLQANASTFAGTVHMPRGVMVHNAAVRIMDVNGRVIDVAIELALVGAGPALGLRPLLQFGAGQLVLDLPRPLGLRLYEGQSLAVYGSLRDSSSVAFSVHVELTYEHGAGPLSRLAALPVQLRLDERRDGGSANAVSSEWHAPVDGRVMVLTGLPLDVAGELLLIDVETGATVWQDRLEAPTAEALAARTDIIRVGVPVRAGRAYRLVLRSADTPRGLSLHVLHILVVPVYHLAARS